MKKKATYEQRTNTEGFLQSGKKISLVIKMPTSHIKIPVFYFQLWLLTQVQEIGFWPPKRKTWLEFSAPSISNLAQSPQLQAFGELNGKCVCLSLPTALFLPLSLYMHICLYVCMYLHICTPPHPSNVAFLKLKTRKLASHEKLLS